MAIATFEQIASVGLIKDVNNELIPSDPLAWTTTTGFRFKDGSIKTIGGSEQIITTSIVPYYYNRVVNNNTSNAYTLYAGANKVYVYLGGVHYNITRQTTGVDVNYNATYDNNWKMCILNTIPVFNNGIDVPQMWSSIDHTVKLSNLSNFPASTTASVIQSFKAYLVAGDVTTSGTRYQSRVYWSGAALPNALPADWDYTSITSDSGYIDLSDTEGAIIDMKQLGDNLLIYKKNSIYAMTYIGGNAIFSIKKIYSNLGALNVNCIAEVDRQHFILTPNDIIMIDGSGNYKSIVDGRMRRYIFDSVNSSIMSRSFVVPHYRNSEIWVVMPVGGGTTECNTVYIFNYVNNTWTMKTLPNSTVCITSSFLDIATLGTFDSYTTQIFDTFTQPYDSTKYNKNSLNLVLVNHSGSNLVLLDSITSNTELGNTRNTVLERTNVKLSDDETIKTIKRLYPKMTLQSGSINSIISWYVGVQMNKNDAIDWKGPFNFNINTDLKIDMFATGRFISIRVTSSSDIGFSLENLEIELVSGGKW